MRFLCFLSLFVATVSAANRTYCSTQTISITQQWVMPMAPMAANSFCTYNFAIPTDSYAVLSIATIDFASSDSFFIMNNFGDRLVMDKNSCTNHCHNMTSESKWPGNFSVTAITGKKEGLQFQVTINLVPLNTTAIVIPRTTATDKGSFLVYFKDWKKETTYTVKSNTSKVYLQVAVDFKNGDSFDEVSQLNDVFVYDGGKNIGTLSHMFHLGYTSQTNTVTLYATKKVALRGAVFFTDFGNIRSLEAFHVEYAPLYDGTNVAKTEVVGSLYPSQEGAMTIISDEDDSEQVTIREVNNRGNGGVFSYKMNGPLASHQDILNPLTNSNLPQNFDGHMNTIYISQGAGDIKYTIFPM